MKIELLNEGMPAPELNIPGSDNKPHSIKDYLGGKLIIFFYPKDNTPGWVNEAVSFKDNLKALEELNYKIIGISRDSLKSHDKFITKHSLPFVLLSDSDETVCNAYGVLKEKNMFGKKVFGIERSTFIIDEKGIVEKIFRKVKAATHVENDILPYIKEIK